MSSAPSRRNHQLDFLRGVAILLVLGRHQPLASDKSVHLESIAWYWYNCGWMGVDLFFVLSGFLIGNGLFAEIKAEDKLNARRFLIKRIFKIWPGYFVLMLLLSTGLTISAEEKKHVIWNWFHLQNYFGSCRVQTWSLAVEEHFYLFLPFVLYLLCKYKKINAMPFIALAIAIYCPLGRFLDLKGAYDYSHLRMDALFFGVLLAYLKQLRAPLFANILRKRWLLLGIGFALVLPISVIDFHLTFVRTLGLSLLYLGFGAILLALLGTDETDGIAGRMLFSKLSYAIGWIGFYSYGIYLWHMDLGFLPAFSLYPMLKSSLPPEISWFCEDALFVLFSILFGVLMSRLIEAPMLKVRDRLISKWFPV